MNSASRSSMFFVVLLIACVIGGLAQQNAPAEQSTPVSQSSPAAEPAAHPQTSTVQAASTTQPQPGTAAVLKVKTRLVVVDVVALDHKGAPVTDLQAEDFNLQEEGSPQKISETLSSAFGASGTKLRTWPAPLTSTRRSSAFIWITRLFRPSPRFQTAP